MTKSQINPCEKYINKNDEITTAISSLKKSFNLGEIDQFTLLKDNIKNYRKLTDIQLAYIHTLSETQKLEIILLYNKMITILENII